MATKNTSPHQIKTVSKNEKATSRNHLDETIPYNHHSVDPSMEIAADVCQPKRHSNVAQVRHDSLQSAHEVVRAVRRLEVVYSSWWIKSSDAA